MDWSKIKYFVSAEFDSPGQPGSGDGMQQVFVELLDVLRSKWGALHINSGIRTVEHNAAVGGVKDSAHLKGYAADLRTADIQEAIRLAIVAARVGFTRIGVDLKGHLVHVDSDPSLPSPATWFYNAS